MWPLRGDVLYIFEVETQFVRQTKIFVDITPQIDFPGGLFICKIQSDKIWMRGTIKYDKHGLYVSKSNFIGVLINLLNCCVPYFSLIQPQPIYIYIYIYIYI